MLFLLYFRALSGASLNQKMLLYCRKLNIAREMPRNWSRQTNEPNGDDLYARKLAHGLMLCLGDGPMTQHETMSQFSCIRHQQSTLGSLVWRLQLRILKTGLVAFCPVIFCPAFVKLIITLLYVHKRKKSTWGVGDHFFAWGPTYGEGVEREPESPQWGPGQSNLWVVRRGSPLKLESVWLQDAQRRRFRIDS